RGSRRAPLRRAVRAGPQRGRVGRLERPRHARAAGRLFHPSRLARRRAEPTSGARPLGHGTGGAIVRHDHGIPASAANGPRPRHGMRRAGSAVLLLTVVALAGCFDKPKLEDRWTRVDIQSSSPVPRQSVAPGSIQAITMHATITYRAIVTGFAVAELRAGDSVAAAEVGLAPDAKTRVPMAQGIDVILQHSRSLGRATQAVTGWDHLIMPLDFSFNAMVPTGPDSTWGGSRLFLLCYMGS